MSSSISDEHVDQLREVVNIGAGNASTALSQLIDKKVTVEVPDVYFGKVESVLPSMGNPDDIMTVVLVKILGDITGIIMLMFPPDDVLLMAKLLTKTPKNVEKVSLDNMDRSALMEVGNILSSTALNSLCKFVGLDALPSIPDTANDMVGSMADNILAEMGQGSREVLIFKICFSVEDEMIKGKLFFLFDNTTTKKIINILNSKN